MVLLKVLVKARKCILDVPEEPAVIHDAKAPRCHPSRSEVKSLKGNGRLKKMNGFKIQLVNRCDRR